MSIEEYIEKRNALQFRAESVSEEFAKRVWTELGVCNRHIERVISGTFSLTIGIEQEIDRCLNRVETLFN